MGVHIISYPPIIRPAERLKYISIPGRSGALIQKEGEEGDPIFDPYTRTMEISNARGGSIDQLRRWLTGEGEMIVGNEPRFKYFVALQAEFQADKLLRGIWGGPLQMYTQPLKAAATPPADLALSASGASVRNPGDVPAQPLLRVTAAGGAATLTLGGKTLAFSDVPTALSIDCAAQWILDGQGRRLINVASGEFGKLPVGASQITWTGGISAVTVTPRWRYL